jgi:hypothetical protein
MADDAHTLRISDAVLVHRRRMGSSIWEYLWLRAHVTSEAPDVDGNSVGVVNHGKPVPTSRIAADLWRSREAALANLERLEAGNYLERSPRVSLPRSHFLGEASSLTV